MLRKRENIIITGESIVDDMVAMTYTATISHENPQDARIDYYMSGHGLYKENREICRADQKEFEEYVYALQDEMLAEIGGTEDGTEE